MTDSKRFRLELMEATEYCEICNHNPSRVRPGVVSWALCVHHVARGRNRHKADHRCSVLVVCFPCHNKIHNELGWPESRQLAYLKRSRPRDFDLAAYNALVGRGPNRITEEEVAAWL